MSKGEKDDVVCLCIATGKEDLRKEVFDIFAGNLVWFFGKKDMLDNFSRLDYITVDDNPDLRLFGCALRKSPSYDPMEILSVTDHDKVNILAYSYKEHVLEPYTVWPLETYEQRFPAKNRVSLLD